jgi:hypothetical protein
VTTGAPGSSASATITGTPPSQTLNLAIPRGDKGDQGNPGPANSLAIGTVTTGAPGSSASASITGTAPSQTLNLTIPRGAAGAGSAASQAEVNTGTDNTKFVTAKTLSERPYFIANLNSGKFTGGYGWKVFGTVADWTVEQKGFGASSAVWWASGVKIPVAGVYLLTGTVLVAASGLLIVGLKKNNTSADGTAMLVSGQAGGFAGWTSASFATEVRLAAGDLLSYATFTDADYGITNTHTRFGVDFMHA